MSTLQATIPTPPVLPGVWLIRRADRLAVRELPSPAPAADADVERALTHLRSYGLVAGISRRARLLILGGTSAANAPEAPIFQEGFMISLEADGTFSILVTGPGPREAAAQARTLTEATEKVLDIYRSRQDAGAREHPSSSR